MRIAHVSATFPPYQAGTGNVCYQNARELARRGHEVQVFTSLLPGTEPSQVSDGFGISRLHPLARVGNAPILPGLLRVKGFDIVHLHYPFYSGAEAVFLGSRAHSLRIVVTYHQDVLLTGALGYLERLHHRWIGTTMLSKAKIVLATSLDYARSSRLECLLRGKPGLVDELPNGVDLERFHPDAGGDELRIRHGLGSEDRVVLFVGALDTPHYFKGVDVLLRAIARLNRQTVKLVIVGDGDLRTVYERHASVLGLQGRVVSAGRVPDEALPGYYGLCDVLVLPSTTSGEAFGLVLLEAMASGKPVVASDLPGVRSVVETGEDGLLVQPRNPDDLAAKLVTLLDAPQLRSQMGKRGRAKVEQRYGWRAIGARLEAVYEKVLSAAPASGVVLR
jgi:glycosyltransferase involved in cell wall biosynthesis